jgi:hypothetical protein
VGAHVSPGTSAAELSAVLAALHLTACCCPCTDGCDTGCDPSACSPDIPAAPVEPVGPEVDLGIASSPPGTPTVSPASYRWTARDLNPNRYKAGYALSPEEARKVQAALDAFARKVQYRPINDTSFTWVPPANCEDDMRCVFADMYRSNRDDVRALAARFKNRVAEANLDAMQAASLVVSFVQAVRYEIPKEEPFGILPPALVLSQQRGDCDSKAFLAQMILHELGIESMLISSQAHKHTMLGIALPVQGTTFTYGGTRYAFTECTAEGSPIGHVNAELLHPNDWKAVPVDLR